MSTKTPNTQTYLAIAGNNIPAWMQTLEQEYARTYKSLTTLQGTGAAPQVPSNLTSATPAAVPLVEAPAMPTPPTQAQIDELLARFQPTTTPTASTPTEAPAPKTDPTPSEGKGEASEEGNEAGEPEENPTDEDALAREDAEEVEPRESDKYY